MDLEEWNNNQDDQWDMDLEAVDVIMEAHANMDNAAEPQAEGPLLQMAMAAGDGNIRRMILGPEPADPIIGWQLERALERDGIRIRDRETSVPYADVFRSENESKFNLLGVSIYNYKSVKIYFCKFIFLQTKLRH